MDNKEINEIMDEYTKALNEKFTTADDSIRMQDIEEGKVEEVFYRAKDNAHKIAIQCLDKILSPELKIFIKNLCYNRLGYPDEPIFYKAFGDYPEEGDKVSEKELVERGIDLSLFNAYIDEDWFWEGNLVVRKEIDGENYYVIESLAIYPETDSEEEWNALRATTALKQHIFRTGDIDERTRDTIMGYVNKLTPMIGKMNM